MEKDNEGAASVNIKSYEESLYPRHAQDPEEQELWQIIERLREERDHFRRMVDRVATEAALAERETCERIAVSETHDAPNDSWANAAAEIAERIRARGKP